MSEYKIPSDEDFERADKWMEEQDRHLSQVCERVKSLFKSKCRLHNIYLLWQRDVDFRTYVFFKKNSDLEACKSNGIVTSIESAVYDELERFGRGKRGEIEVAFEYDSHENVTKNYDGDYLLRLR
jgi:hypothetical protein